MHFKNWVIFVFLILGFFVLGRQKTPVQSNAPKNPEVNDKISQEVLSLVLSDPDSVSDAIKDIVTAETRRHGCDGFHIVQAIGAEQIPKYCVTFFNDYDGPVERVLMDHKGAIEYLTDAEKEFLGSTWKSHSLKKADQATICWDLPTVYKNANYGGDSYTFTQSRYYQTGDLAN